jgi:hypothetical protein
MLTAFTGTGGAAGRYILLCVERKYTRKYTKFNSMGIHGYVLNHYHRLKCCKYASMLNTGIIAFYGLLENSSRERILS